MTGRLIKKLIGGRIYPNSYIWYNNEPKLVERVNDKTVVVQDDEGNMRRISKEEVDGCVIKYSIQTDNRIYDLSYSDYILAITSPEIVEGYVVQVKTKAHIGSDVRIGCLATVDTHNLIDPKSRFGIIKSQDRSSFTIELTNNSKTMVLHRSQFILVNQKDVKYFFKLICPKCGR